ncbi:dihydroorotase [compost metagenome]
MLRYTDMELAEAVEAVTERPAQVMAMTGRGALAEGAVADLTLFDYDPAAGAISVRETVVAGSSVYRRTGPSPDRP